MNKVTDSAIGDRIYETNRKIIDLSDPLMPDEAKELLDMYIHMPMDPDDRNMQNLHHILLENKVENLTDDRVFSTFFSDYLTLAENEKKFYIKYNKS